MSTFPKLPAPTFDLDSWSSNYTGPILLLRLRHIAINCPSLTSQALHSALATAKAGRDVHIYQSLISLSAALQQPVQSDTDWVARQDEGNKRELARLEGELRGYKNNLIRESIRMGQEDLASHLLSTGGPLAPTTKDDETKSYGFAAAYVAYGKMRDYCTTPTHIAVMTLRLLFTALVQAVSAAQFGGAPQGYFSAVNTQASRLSASGVKAEEDAKLKPIWLAARGIAQLGQYQYREAAENFSQVDFVTASNGPIQNFDFCHTSASLNDIAIYGGLTALATMSREELNDSILGGELRAFLELEPHLRKAITLFTTGKYRACLDTLGRYYSDWNLDVFLGIGYGSVGGSHVDRLFARIREKSITAYFKSFSQVSLTSLAQTFPAQQGETSIDQLAHELTAMIEDGTLDARLDTVNSILVSPHNSSRSATQTYALETANESERTLLQRLYKINITLAGLDILSAKQQNANQHNVLNGAPWQQSMA